MNPEAFSFNVDIDDEYITVWWRRSPSSTLDILTRYPELQLRFRYRDISSDTVEAMLRDMEVPDQMSKSIMTRVTANAS